MNMKKRNVWKKKLTGSLAVLSVLLLTGCGASLTNENLRGHYVVDAGALSTSYQTGGNNQNSGYNQGFGQQLVSFGSSLYMVFNAGSVSIPLASGTYSITNSDRLMLLPSSSFGGSYGRSAAQELILSNTNSNSNGNQTLRIWKFNNDQISIRQLRFEEFQFQVGSGFGGGQGQNTQDQLRSWYDNPDTFIQLRSNGGQGNNNNQNNNNNNNNNNTGGRRY